MKNHDPAMASDKVVQLSKLHRTALVPAVSRPQAPVVVPFHHWVAVRDQAAAGLLAGGKRLLLTGPAGTGKTVLLDHLARVLRAAGRPVIVQLADADPQPPALGTTLFVDEADRLAEAQRRDLQAAPGTLVLAGLGSLAPRRLPAGTTHLTLEPLDHDASRSFVAQWLKLNGRTPSDLESPAVRRLIELSGGVPRLMSTLLASSVWLAETSGAPTVSAGHVQEAAELRSVLGAAAPALRPAEPVRRGRPGWSAALAVVVLAGTAAAVMPRLFPRETERGVVWAEDLVLRAERWVRNEPPPKPPATLPSPVPVPVAVPAEPPVAAPVEPPPTPVVIIDPPAAETRQMEDAAATPEPAPEREPEPAPVPDTAPPAAAAEPAMPPPAPEPARPTQARQPDLPIETIAFLIRRGTEMMQLNDLSAARLLFRRAADSGSAEAMLNLARTFDPAVLAAQGAAPMGDLVEASEWYRRAAEGGNEEAEAILRGK